MRNVNGFIRVLAKVISSSPIFKALVSVVLLSVISAAQNPPSRPILFAHGFCGSALDFQPLLSSLYQQLPQSLYPNSTVYYASYDSVLSTTTFYTLSNGGLAEIDEGSIPVTARFFSILLAGC
jgi:hypothetical protein